MKKHTQKKKKNKKKKNKKKNTAYQNICDHIKRCNKTLVEHKIRVEKENACGVGYEILCQNCE